MPRKTKFYTNAYASWFRPENRRTKRQKSFLQFLYKRKGQINQKTRKRKYKTRIKNNRPVRPVTCRGEMYPRRPTYVGLRAVRACRMTYLTLIGMEKCFMPSKGKVQARYRRFPDFFVTRKSSKSRMGKGKGKIMGRVLRIKRDETVLDVKSKNIFKAKKSLRALRLAIPTTTRLIFKNRWVRRRLTMTYRNRSWKSFRKKKKKKKFWQIALERASKAKKKSRRKAGRKFPLIWRLQHKTRWLFFRWKLDHDRKDKKYIDEDRPFIRKYGLKLARSASRGRRMLKKFSRRAKRRIYSRVKPRLHANYLKKAGFSGGTSRYFLIRYYASKFHMRRIYEQQFIPDAEGYLGFLKMANKLIKKKMLREQFKVRRQIPSPLIGRY